MIGHLGLTEGHAQQDIGTSEAAVAGAAQLPSFPKFPTDGGGAGSLNGYLQRVTSATYQYVSPEYISLDTKWTKSVDVRQLGNLPTSPELQHKMAELTQSFPTPRLQTDDGNQDVADLHEREGLLLDNYSWVDPSQTGAQGKVRIPIERSMEIVAQRGLPVAPASTQQAELMTGDSKPTVAVPLTSGYAPTAYEQEEAATKAAEARQKQE